MRVIGKVLVIGLAVLGVLLCPGWAGPAAAGIKSGPDQPAAGAGNNDFFNRIMKILYPDQTPPPDIDNTWEGGTPIFGPPEVTKKQVINYILKRNPAPKLACSVAELVDIYWEEAGQEGIRPDLAISQAILETGAFNFGNDVIPDQNNYSGLGATGRGVKGAFFSSPRIGVRAQIQHLLAYAASRPPFNPIVDPRYELLKRSNKYGRCDTWESLSGRWAVPGTNYGKNILEIFEQIKKF